QLADRVPRRGYGALARDPARHRSHLAIGGHQFRARSLASGVGSGDRGTGGEMSDAPPVETRGLVKRYGDIVAGDLFGYLGPNGAGKTTSLRIMLGLIRPSSGSARLFGRDPLIDGAKALDG